VIQPDRPGGFVRLLDESAVADLVVQEFGSPGHLGHAVRLIDARTSESQWPHAVDPDGNLDVVGEFPLPVPSIADAASDAELIGDVEGRLSVETVVAVVIVVVSNVDAAEIDEAAERGGGCALEGVNIGAIREHR